ncbi:MAG: tRNA uridine-5-carboxymethylaminomethyl(34) synthesis GTPase MnmE [Pseudomonadota bacterium]
MAVKTQFGDTVFALSTAPGRAGVAVIRLSGSGAYEAACLLSSARTLPVRRASLRTLSYENEPIDEALVLYFPGPNSFTGEDVVELQCHGSFAVIEAISNALLSIGLRQARAGEFTRRAVENGRMDLTEAEGLADLIDAQSSAQRQQALRQMDGQLRETYEGWREGLLDALAQIEGEIDFADEADVPDALSHAARPHLDRVIANMECALARADQGQAIRDGIDIAIIGAPNAGKSTLLNQLVGRDVAITSPQAGTTRDIVEAQMVLSGIPVTVSDTAGLRETEDAIEAEGVRRALRRAEDAHLRILLRRETQDETYSTLLREGDIVLDNVDSVSNENEINALDGTGLDRLLERLSHIIQSRFTGGEPAGLTRSRHADCARRALTATQSAITHLGIAPELSGEDIRAALRAIDELAGRSDIEEVFDRIFSQFCVGK